MAGTVKRLAGPVALSATLTTNVYNQASALLTSIITHIEIVNKTGVAATFSLWLGATGANAAGTEVIGTAKVVAANDTFHWYGRKALASTDFLVGGAGTAAALTITVEGELVAV